MDKTILARVEAALASHDDAFGEMLVAALGNHVGYIYLRTACIAQVMGVSLSTMWNKHGKQALEDFERDMLATAPADATHTLIRGSK